MDIARVQLKRAVWMHTALEISKLSTCRRLQVGAVLLRRDGSVAGVGYNGALPGQPHCDEATCNPTTRCFQTRHAERSALDYSQGDISVAYVTHEPCLRCTQDLIARGCRSVYFCEPYVISDAVERAARVRHRMDNDVAWIHLRLTEAKMFEVKASILFYGRAWECSGDIETE